MDVTVNDPQEPLRTGLSSSNESTNGDDAESWTILDEDLDDLTSDLQESALLQQVAAKVQDVRAQHDNANNYYDLQSHADDIDTDSDIERIDERIKTKTDDGLDSLRSDGIPVGDKLSGERDQYIWASENTTDSIENTDSDEADASPSKKSEKVTDLSTQYPEELPDRLSEIVKGRTYTHMRNQHLNLILSGVLIIVIAGALGLGIGNFLGWSSRIEIHEQFAEVQDEKLEELTDSLVSCMTGPEGQGGDDQDLDDKVIHHLSEENRRLKEELELVREGHEIGVAEEMTVILRDRINDLLTANAELEREVARLRYAPVKFDAEQHEDPEISLEQTRSDLKQTKESLNEIAAENEQLKIAIGKARYGGPPPTPQEEQDRILQLQLENEELKTEVQKIRNSLAAVVAIEAFVVPDAIVVPVEVVVPEEAVPVPWQHQDEDPLASADRLREMEKSLELIRQETRKGQRHDVAESDYPLEFDEPTDYSFEVSSNVESSDFDVSVDSLINNDLIGDGYVSDVESDEDLVPGESEKEDELDEAEEEESQFNKADDEEKENIGTVFKAAKELLNDWSKKIGQNDWASIRSEDVSKVLEKMKKLGTTILPQETADQISVLSKIVQDKGLEMKELLENTLFRDSKNKDDVNLPQKLAGKFAKTLKGTLQRLSDILTDDISDRSEWEKRVHNLRENMERKWSGIKSGFKSFFRRDKKQEEKSENHKKGDEGKFERVKRSSDAIISEIEKPVKTHRKWSKKADNTETEKKRNETSSKWIFARAEIRQKARHEEQRSDWVFERAQDRKKFHDLMGADWHTRRYFNKQCEQNGENDESCVDMDPLNVASINHGKTARGDTLSFDKSKTILPPDVMSSSQRHVGIKPDIFAPKFDDLRDDLDDDDNEDEDEVDDHKILKKKHRQDFRDEFFSGGFVGARLGPKKLTGGKVDPQWRASKKIDKRGRFQHHNSDKHYRRNNKKPYIMENVKNMFNKFH